jgi:hypothetical protein
LQDVLGDQEMQEQIEYEEKLKYHIEELERA